MLQDLDLVAVGVGDEGHFFAVDKFLTPVGGPQVQLEVEAFEHGAVLDDVVDTNAGVNQVLGDVHGVVGRVGELKVVRAAGDLQMRKLVAGWRLVGAAQHVKATGLAIPVDGLLEVGDADAGVIKCGSHTLSYRVNLLTGSRDC